MPVNVQLKFKSIIHVIIASSCPDVGGRWRGGGCSYTYMKALVGGGSDEDPLMLRSDGKQRKGRKKSEVRRRYM